MTTIINVTNLQNEVAAFLNKNKATAGDYKEIEINGTKVYLNNDLSIRAFFHNNEDIDITNVPSGVSICRDAWKDGVNTYFVIPKH